MKNPKSIKQPFFSKLLEAQKLDSTKNIKGGKDPVTMKWPSDGDEV